MVLAWAILGTKWHNPGTEWHRRISEIPLPHGQRCCSHPDSRECLHLLHLCSLLWKQPGLQPVPRAIGANCP